MYNYYDDYGEFTDNISDEDVYDNWTSEHFFESLSACIGPSLSQIRNYVLILVGMSGICHFSWQCLRFLPLSKSMELLQHCLATMCGLISIYAILEFDIFILLFFAIFSYSLLILLEYFKNIRLRNSYGSTLAIILIGAHFIYELVSTSPDMWQRLRGIQMLSMMKTISLAYDLENSQSSTHKSNEAKISKLKTVPGPIPYFGYIFSPATCILGPWISYYDYTRSLHTQHFSIIGILKCLLNIGLAIGFLLISNCVVPLLGDHPYIDNWKWLRAYLNAVSVRSSHYFICFLSQATLLAAGHTQPDENALLGPLVVRPWQIEWPRSLSALVRSWNIPMHHWLKFYVFKPLYTVPGNYILPVMGTYLVSALLHGLHVRIYLVLLSLAMFSFAEQVLRKKLANIFNACIGSDPCKKEKCKYTHCPYRCGWKNITTWSNHLVNLLFRCLAILHLAYLGIMMHTSHTDGDLISTDDVRQKLSKLSFLSHWIALGTFIFYYLI